MKNYHQVALLITTYNRSRSLENLLTKFTELQIVFGEVIVSDDGSKQEHLEFIRSLQERFSFQLVEAPKNAGLAANINKGQNAVSLPYILYVQEDFEPLPAFEKHFDDALDFMETDKQLDIARFYAYFAYPYKKPYGKGFSVMDFRSSLYASDHIKFYVYSDHPHLRRKTFAEKFGPFHEGVSGDQGEFEMALSFIKNGGKGIFFDHFNTMFEQRNSSAEPSTMNRADWRQNKGALFLMVRAAYLKIKLLGWTYKLWRFRKR